MLILGIDTANLLCSISLLNDQCQIYQSNDIQQLLKNHLKFNVTCTDYNIHSPKNQCIQIQEIQYTKQNMQTEYIISLLKQYIIINNISLDDIHCISCNIGPGSFTGMRIGASITYGMLIGMQQKQNTICDTITNHNALMFQYILNKKYYTKQIQADNINKKNGNSLNTNFHSHNILFITCIYANPQQVYTNAFMCYDSIQLERDFYKNIEIKHVINFEEFNNNIHNLQSLYPYHQIQILYHKNYDIAPDLQEYTDFHIDTLNITSAGITLSTYYNIQTNNINIEQSKQNLLNPLYIKESTQNNKYSKS